MKVFVVASAPVARAGLRAMLAEEDGVEVVGAADSFDAPGFSGADVVLVADEALVPEAVGDLAEYRSQGLLVLSDDEGAVAMLRGTGPGGWGMLAPDAPPEEISAAIQAVGNGLVVLPEALAERLLGAPSASGVMDGDGGGDLMEPLAEPLTAREREVLDLLGQGLSNRLIARELHISEHTVKFHVSSVYAKLGVGSRAGAVSQGARRGLISL
ncbi:MAG TPA: response regulator transcription factor [Rubrobacteraceae bacterium]|nr:response regulator transcription factor [Rubrobacteraceae bacterium]